MVGRVKGSPTHWRLDASEDPEMVEEEDKEYPQLNLQLRERVGSRTGESRSMYLSRRDFEVHGFTDGCVGCRNIANGKRRRGSFLSPHNLAGEGWKKQSEVPTQIDGKDTS